MLILYVSRRFILINQYSLSTYDVPYAVRGAGIYWEYTCLVNLVVQKTTDSLLNVISV